MFFFLSKLLDVFLSPYTWGLMLLAAAVPWRARKARRWRPRRRAGIAGLVLLMMASTVPVSNALLFHLEHQSKPTYRDDVTYDTVVLLGGIVDEEASAASGQPAYNENVERVVMTHRLLQEGRAKTVIVSGAAADPKLAYWGEAVALGRQLEAWGIEKERIIIEDKAKNTRENAVYAQAIARERGFRRVLIVTSAFHMPRAAECFSAVGMSVDTFPVDFRSHERVSGPLGDWLPRPHSLAVTSAAMRELFGRLVYRVQGYGKPVP